MPITKPLTDPQIDALFAFVESKYVDFYDVQVELVDHLASEVEQRMAAEPGVTFDAALQQVYRGFGIFGFSNLVEEKQNAVLRRSWILWWKSVKNLFRLPLLVGSLAGGILVYIGYDFLGPLAFVHTNAGVSLLAVVGQILYIFKNTLRKKFKLTALQLSGPAYGWSIFHFHPIYFFNNAMIGSYSPEACSILVPLLCWISWIVFTASALSYGKLIKESRKQFPIAFA